MPGPGGTFDLTEADDHFPQVGSSDDNSGAEWINALRGSDTVLAGTQDDTVFGGIGDDEIFGEAGDDLLDGGGDNDRIEGGIGNDRITDLEGAFAFIDAGSGNDLVYIASGFQTGSVIAGGTGHDVLHVISATSLTLIALSGFEELAYASADHGVVMGTAKQFNGFGAITWGVGEVPPDYAALGLYGLAGKTYTVNLSAELGLLAVLFTGSIGDDRVTTGSGNDTVYGDLGDDRLSGGKGRDDLHGSGGNDTLRGGQGRDTLTGSGGDDTFIYGSVKDSSTTGDRVVGWGNGNDIIDLSAIDAVGGGTDDDFAFVGTGPVTGSGGEVAFANTATQTVVNVYLDGDTVADMRIVINGVFALTDTDFAL